MSKKAEDMNIHERLHAIMTQVGVVGKDGTNSFQKYKYASEASYLRALRPLLSEYRVAVVPNVKTMMHDPNKENLLHLLVEFTFVNIDDPSDTVVATMMSSGADTGDKAIYKAITGAKKYILANTFMTETGDDAEADKNDYEQQVKTTKPAKASGAKKSLLNGESSGTSFNPKKVSSAIPKTNAGARGFGV